MEVTTGQFGQVHGRQAHGRQAHGQAGISLFGLNTWTLPGIGVAAEAENNEGQLEFVRLEPARVNSLHAVLSGVLNRSAMYENKG